MSTRAVFEKGSVQQERKENAEDLDSVKDTEQCACGSAMLATSVDTNNGGGDVVLIENRFGTRVKLSCWICPSCGAVGPLFIAEGSRKRFEQEYTKRKANLVRARKVYNHPVSLSSSCMLSTRRCCIPQHRLYPTPSSSTSSS